MACPDRIKPREPAAAVLILLAIALLAGGGGVTEAFGNLAVQLAALLVLAVFGPLSVRTLGMREQRSLLVLLAASCLLPLVQLVPLPPALWQVLPGRDLVAQSLDLTGGRGWFPWTVDRGRTLVAFLGTIAPLTVILVGLSLRPDRLIELQRALPIFSLVVAIFGAFQLLAPEWGDLYVGQRPMPGILVGTFADRNAAALFFVCCLLTLVGLPRVFENPRNATLQVIVGVVLLVAVILTRSRSGIALLAFPAILLTCRFSAIQIRLRADSRAGPGPLPLTAIAAGSLAALALIFTSGQARTSFDRFGEGDGMRAEMRADALFTAQRYWPVGAGMGTFDEVFQVDESLEFLSPRKAGRAHMDYYELAIEAGVAGLALLAGWFMWLGVAAWRALRQPAAWPARAAALGLLAIAAQSVVSFPLRNQAMLCVAAVLVILLARSPALGVKRKLKS